MPVDGAKSTRVAGYGPGEGPPAATAEASRAGGQRQRGGRPPGLGGARRPPPAPDADAPGVHAADVIGAVVVAGLAAGSRAYTDRRPEPRSVSAVPGMPEVFTSRTVFQPEVVLGKARYLYGAQRQKHRVSFGADGVLRDTDGRPFAPAGTGHPDAAAGRRALFVMDVKGNFYASLRPDHPVPDAERIKHSSFLAGGEVLMAGEMTVRNGKILKMDNCSGHYLPTASSLKNLQKHLKTKYDVDCPIEVFNPPWR